MTLRDLINTAIEALHKGQLDAAETALEKALGKLDRQEVS
jgi:hypothetical protein